MKLKTKYGEKILACLVPKNESGITCHEKTLCDCEVIELLEKLKTQNAKYREALRFYADDNNHIPPIYKPTGKPGAAFTSPYRIDSGKIARKALEMINDT